jgi:Large eukaryotic DNA virus major capsid protein
LTGKPLRLVPIYNFALNSPNTQPCGSVNASRIRNFQIEVDVYPLPVNTNYVYDLNVYVENINFLVIEGGMGGLKYAL